jgi:hypothetical protein
VVHRGPNAGSRFLLDSELTTAGRHPVQCPGRRQPERHLCQPGPDRGDGAVQRGRGADRKVPAHLHDAPAPPGTAARRRRTGLRMSERLGRGAAWTDERDRSEEGRRRSEVGMGSRAGPGPRTRAGNSA